MPDETGRQHSEQILRHVIKELDPQALVSGAIDVGDDVRVAGASIPRSNLGRLVICAVGKASIPMATGALDVLGNLVDQAVAVTKSGISLPVDPPEELEVLEADHPVPTEASTRAGARILEVVADLQEHDVVIMLISGGGSALIESLVDEVTLDDLRETTDHMLRAGATINELNAVRRRISRLKGGRLARAIAPAKIINLIVSDVLNSPLQDIASGPTVRPPDHDLTFESVLQRQDLIGGLPDSVRSRLDHEREVRDADNWPDNVLETVILSDAETAARAAVAAAVGLGYRVQTLGFDFQGEAREFGRTWGTMARHATRVPEAFALPVALIGAGELTVTVRGDGAGGRNTEMALAASLEVIGNDRITITSFATDGDDGISGCAGGIVDGTTSQRCDSAGLDPHERLQVNDSATVLEKVGQAIDVGPTGTNVNDLYLALIQSNGSQN